MSSADRELLLLRLDHPSAPSEIQSIQPKHPYMAISSLWSSNDEKRSERLPSLLRFVLPSSPPSFRFGLEVHRAQTHLLGGFDIETEGRLSREVDLDMMTLKRGGREGSLGKSLWW